LKIELDFLKKSGWIVPSNNQNFSLHECVRSALSLSKWIERDFYKQINERKNKGIKIMGIDGRMQIDIIPGIYANDENEKQKAHQELKCIIRHLNLSNYVTIENEVIVNGFPIQTLTVYDNRNFWFQYTQLPKMVIPEFWKLSKDEIESQRLKMIEDKDCVINCLKKLSKMTNSLIYITESYDSSAEGDYNYFIGEDDNRNTIIRKDLSKSNILDYHKAIHDEIENVKRFAATYKKNNPNKLDVINKAAYWGLFK